MILRLWHFLYGHDWRERDVVFNPPIGFYLGVARCDSEHFMERGFTDITLTCPCGALKVHRLIGKHTEASDSDVEALRKMAGLK